MSLQTHPSIPPFASFFFFFESNMHPLKLHLDGPRVWSQSARLLKRRNKDISPQQPCCSCKHLHTLEKKQVLLLVFIANLECTVNLKPLILSVCSSFHHIFAELFIFYIFFWKTTRTMNQLCDGNQPRGPEHVNEWRINRNLGEEQERTCFVFGVVVSAWSAVCRVLCGPDWAWFALSEYVSLPPQWRWHAPRSWFTPDLWAASVKARHCSGLFRTYAHAHKCTHTHTHTWFLISV